MKIEEQLDPHSITPRGIGIINDKLITANKDTSDISVIDLRNGKLVRHIKIGTSPEFIKIHKNLVYVSNEPGGVSVVDINKDKKLRDIRSSDETEGIEIVDNELVVTNEADNTITSFDINTGKLLRTLNTGERPRGIKLSPSAKYYIATLEFGSSFIVFDRNFKLLKTVPTSEKPVGVSFNNDRIYISGSKFEVFDSNFKLIKSIKAGNRCWHFTFTPDNKDILLACGKSNEIVDIDTDKLVIKKRIPNKGTPWGIVTQPRSAGSIE
jgi:DNA-binding beta-propeller fold protein YncE